MGRRRRRRRWRLAGFVTVVLLGAYLIFGRGGDQRDGELVNPLYFVPSYVPDGFTLVRATPGGGPPSLDVRWTYLGEPNRANPFEQRDALVVTTRRNEDRLFRDEGDPVAVLDTTGRFADGDRELGFPINKLQFAHDGIWVTMLSRHLDRAALVSLAASMTLADHALLGNPTQGLATIADLAAGPLGVNQAGMVIYSSYERGGEFVRIVTGDSAQSVTAQQWWGSEPTTIGKQPAARSQVNLAGAERDVTTYTWVASNQTVVSVIGNIDDAALRRVANSAHAIKGSTRGKLIEKVFAASDPFGRPGPSPSVVDANGVAQIINASWRTSDGDWYYGWRGDEECLTVWLSGQSSSTCDRLVERPGRSPTISVSIGGTRFFIVHAPLTTFSVIVESSDGRSMRLDNLGNTRDPLAKSVYLGQFDDSSSQTSVTWTARITSVVGAVTTSTLEFTTSTAPAPSTTR